MMMNFWNIGLIVVVLVFVSATSNVHAQQQLTLSSCAGGLYKSNTDTLFMNEYQTYILTSATTAIIDDADTNDSDLDVTRLKNELLDNNNKEYKFNYQSQLPNYTVIPNPVLNIFYQTSCESNSSSRGGIDVRNFCNIIRDSDGKYQNFSALTDNNISPPDSLAIPLSQMNNRASVIRRLCNRIATNWIGLIQNTKEYYITNGYIIDSSSSSTSTQDDNSNNNEQSNNQGGVIINDSSIAVTTKEDIITNDNSIVDNSNNEEQQEEIESSQEEPSDEVEYYYYYYNDDEDENAMTNEQQNLNLQDILKDNLQDNSLSESTTENLNEGDETIVPNNNNDITIIDKTSLRKEDSNKNDPAITEAALTSSSTKKNGLSKSSWIGIIIGSAIGSCLLLTLCGCILVRCCQKGCGSITWNCSCCCCTKTNHKPKEIIFEDNNNDIKNDICNTDDDDDVITVDVIMEDAVSSSNASATRDGIIKSTSSTGAIPVILLSYSSNDDEDNNEQSFEVSMDDIVTDEDNNSPNGANNTSGDIDAVSCSYDQEEKEVSSSTSSSYHHVIIEPKYISARMTTTTSTDSSEKESIEMSCQSFESTSSHNSITTFKSPRSSSSRNRTKIDEDGFPLENVIEEEEAEEEAAVDWTEEDEETLSLSHIHHIIPDEPFSPSSIDHTYDYDNDDDNNTDTNNRTNLQNSSNIVPSTLTSDELIMV